MGHEAACAPPQPPAGRTALKWVERVAQGPHGEDEVRQVMLISEVGAGSEEVVEVRVK